MTDTPSRMFALVCVLILIWVGVYWLYEPRSGVASDGRAGGAVRDTPAPIITRDDGPPPEPQPRVEPEPAPLPPPPTPVPQAAEPASPPLPAPEPAPHTRVVPPRFRDYVVQRGDVSFEAVAQRVFNDRRKWDIIARANPLVSSDRLKPGKTVLKIPLDPENIQGKVVTESPGAGGAAAPQPPSSPSPPPGQTTYVVQADDTLWGIAKKVYGKGSLWRTIYDANRDKIKDPDRPTAGAVLTVPPKPKD